MFFNRGTNMKQVIDVVKKYKIQIILICILLLFIPMIYISVQKFGQNYKVETIGKEKYFVLLSNNQTGVIDEKGNIIIEPQYYNVCIPNPTKAIFVCFYDYNEQSGDCKTKVINSQGTELFTQYNNLDVIELNGIETTTPFEKNLLKYQNRGKYGLINLEGDVVTEAIYDEITGLSCKEGELLVKENEKYGVINNRGAELIKAKYDYIAGDEYYASQPNYQVSGYIVGEKKTDGYRYGYLNGKRRMVLDTEYNEITRIGGIQEENTDKDIFLIARKNGRCGLIKNRKTIIDFKYQDINYSGVSNLFIVTRNTKSGVFTSTGKKVLDTKYDEITVHDAYIETVNNGEEAFFNLGGKPMPKDRIPETSDQEESDNSNAKKAVASMVPEEKDGKWGFVDKNSKVVVDYQYDEVTDINKYGFAGIKKDGKWGSIDEKGNIVQEPIYQLDELDDISFIGKYYKIVYDSKEIYYTDDAM